MKRKNIMLSSIFAFSILLSSCVSYESVSEIDYSINDIHSRVSYYSSDVSISTINISTVYVLDLSFSFDINKTGLVGYNDVSLVYSAEEFEINDFPYKDSYNHLRYFIKGLVVKNEASIRINTASGYYEDLTLNIADNIIDSEVLTTGNGGSGFGDFIYIKSVEDFNNIKDDYPEINGYLISPTQFDEEYFNRYFIIMFNFGYSSSEYIHKFKYVFVDDNKLLFDFDVRTNSDQEYDFLQRLYAIKIDRVHIEKTPIIYKSRG